MLTKIIVVFIVGKYVRFLHRKIKSYELAGVAKGANKIQRATEEIHILVDLIGHQKLQDDSNFRVNDPTRDVTSENRITLMISEKYLLNSLLSD
jgi:hypothetical protein